MYTKLNSCDKNHKQEEIKWCIIINKSKQIKLRAKISKAIHEAMILRRGPAGNGRTFHFEKGYFVLNEY